ncbi:hypothetical protein [Brevibacillus massiliensis]|uniref:hypothetical protein n=1 Tax=Brevibacillus massiliensis TaxID=1118054 RepID=UPI000309AC36|nr:hypothetical protein [Brevibacillus massiliensis]
MNPLLIVHKGRIRCPNRWAYGCSTRWKKASKSKEIVSIPLEQVPRLPQTAEAGVDQKTSYPVWLIALVPILFAALLAIFIRMWRKQKQDRQGDK